MTPEEVEKLTRPPPLPAHEIRDELSFKRIQEIADKSLATFVSKNSKKIEAILAPDVIESMKKSLPEYTDEDVALIEAAYRKNLDDKSRLQEWEEKLRKISYATVTWSEEKEDKNGKKVPPKATINFPLLSEHLTALYHVIGFNNAPWIYFDGRYQLGHGELQKTCLKIFEYGNLKNKSKENVSEAIFRVT